MQVRAALDDTPTAPLRRMAAHHGLPADESTTRGELVDRLAERLSDAAYLAELIDSLADDERAALLAASASGGEVRGLLMDREQPGAAPGLVERGLLFRTFAAAGPRRGEIFAIPDEILAVLPIPPAAEPPPAHEPPPPAPERRSTDPAFSLFALLSALARGATLEQEVRAWSAEPGASLSVAASSSPSAGLSPAPAVSPAPTLTPPAEHAAAARAATGFDWSARWTFMEHLAESCGLLAADASPSALRRALDDPPALADRLRRAYLRDRAWSELAAISASVGLEDAAALADPTLVRAAILDAVNALPEEAWITRDAFSAWLQRTAPNFLREQLDARGLLLVESRSWAELERPLVDHVLLGPLYWLGEIATTADARLIARRGRLQRAPHKPEPCTWSDSNELLAPARTRLGTLLEAERYLVLEERGRTSLYRLVQQHVAAALGSGGSIDEFRRLLARLTQAALPAAVDERLASWHARYGAVAVRPAVLVEARSEDELDAALAEDTVQPYIQRRLGPLTAEVAAADALELATALRTTGHLPRVDAALRLVADARRSYPGLIDEQVLEFLLVSLLAFRQARPERLAELEGATSLLGRLERQFPPERLSELRTAAERLAGDLRASPATSRARARNKTARRRPQGTTNGPGSAMRGPRPARRAT